MTKHYPMFFAMIATSMVAIDVTPAIWSRWR